MGEPSELQEELIEQSKDLQDLSPLDLPRTEYLSGDGDGYGGLHDDDDDDDDDVVLFPSFHVSELDRPSSFVSSFQNPINLHRGSSQIAIIGSKYAPVESLDYE